jgi:starch synthase
MRIVHLAAEVAPFAKTGGLGDVVGALPKAQADLGHDVAVFMPLYREARRALGKLGITAEWVCDPQLVHLGFRAYEVGFLRAKLPGSDVPVYFVGSDAHFDRAHLYARPSGGGDDGLLRYAVFVRAAFELMRRLGIVPDVVHAHDWHTALAPMALAWDRPVPEHLARAVSVLTVHNLAYQGHYAESQFVNLGIHSAFASRLEWRGALNLMKGGLLSADVITAVSPTFAREIESEAGGFKLDPVVRHRRGDVVGIVNGIDPNVWNPRTDRKLPANYDASDFDGKLRCREALLRRAGMDPHDRSFVVGMVGRLTSQKGMDLLFPVLGDLLGAGVRFVVLGSGDDDLEAELLSASHHARGRFWGYVGFDDELAHQIEAGVDAFLMPSRFEPCGLNQLYSLAYGTPPIVRRVGGLADTVIPFDGSNAEYATGFGFDAARPSALRDTVLWAQRCYRDPGLWTRIVKNGMTEDNSWERSARRYVDVYAQARAARFGR